MREILAPYSGPSQGEAPKFLGLLPQQTCLPNHLLEWAEQLREGPLRQV